MQNGEQCYTAFPTLPDTSVSPCGPVTVTAQSFRSGCQARRRERSWLALIRFLASDGSANLGGVPDQQGERSQTRADLTCLGAAVVGGAGSSTTSLYYQPNSLRSETDCLNSGFDIIHRTTSRTDPSYKPPARQYDQFGDNTILQASQMSAS